MSMFGPPRDPYDAGNASAGGGDYPPPPGAAESAQYPTAPPAPAPNSAPPPAPARSRGEGLLMAGIVAAVAAVSVVTTLIVSSVSSDDASPTGDTKTSVDPKDDPFGDLPADDTQRGQLGDCVYHWPVSKDDPNGPQRGRLVKCSDSKANSRIYFFSTGTTNADDCPRDPDGNPVKVYFQIDYNTSDTDDYVICLQEI